MCYYYLLQTTIFTDLEPLKVPILNGKCIHSCLKITPSIFLVLIRSDLGNSGKEFKLPSNWSLFFLLDFTKVSHTCKSCSLSSAHPFAFFSRWSSCSCPKTRIRQLAFQQSKEEAFATEGNHWWKGRMAKYLQAAEHSQWFSYGQLLSVN